MPAAAVRLDAVVAALGGELVGDGATLIDGIAPIEASTPSSLSFLSNPLYQSQLASSAAACVIVSPAMRAAAVARGACIVTDDPYLYFARLTQWWRRASGRGPAPGIHPSAVVDPGAEVHPTATVGPLCVVERGARIGEGSWLKSRVTLGEDCHIGARCIVHAGVSIGADGFGFAMDAERHWEKIEQLGGVRIGDDVEIGANTCIDRGALGDTTIGRGVKIDNLVQIGHNVRIGDHSIIAGCVGIAGSAVIGRHCILSGGSAVLGHLTLADHVRLSARTMATRSIAKAGHYTGFYPLDDNAKWEKNAAVLKQLHGLRDRVRSLERSLPPAAE
ncbi:MAG: UDP-3-O-(3-hydroxymyristoyl)glucosamine N-acyltransferase [Xylophilus ampelinus]